MLAIHGGRPKRCSLRDFIAAFITFREEVITRRTKVRIGQVRAKGRTILLGSGGRGCSNLDEVVDDDPHRPQPRTKRARACWPRNGRSARFFAHISGWSKRSSPTPDQGERDLSPCPERQVKAILELRLHRLTAAWGR